MVRKKERKKESKPVYIFNEINPNWALHIKSFQETQKFQRWLGLDKTTLN